MQFNGLIPLQFIGITQATSGEFSGRSTNLTLLTFGISLVSFLSSLSAFSSVWQISHKILLMTAALIMTQCWLIFFFTMDIDCSRELFVVIAVLLLVY